MVIRANTESKFLLKYLFIGLVCLGFAGWAAYDGFVQAPHDLPRAEFWDGLKADQSLDSATRDSRYKAFAKENGWPSKRPSKSVDDIHQYIIWQYVFLVLGTVVGLPCLVWFLRNRGTWIETKEGGLRASWGQELEFEQIKEFDKKKWEKKGIGVLTYQTPGGDKRFVVDDLKYDRNNMDQIVRIIESNIAPELIVNGEPEPAESEDGEETSDLDPRQNSEQDITSER